jgi:GGDEF domain-containing protein
VTVAVIDLDGLKEINDRDGHEAGDDALRAAANALQGLVRRSDRAYRHGGDEFALVLSDAVVLDSMTIVDRMLRQGGPSCSVGLASSSGDDPSQLLAIADGRMYAGRRMERRSRV